MIARDALARAATVRAHSRISWARNDLCRGFACAPLAAMLVLHLPHIPGPWKNSGECGQPFGPCTRGTPGRSLAQRKFRAPRRRSLSAELLKVSPTKPESTVIRYAAEMITRGRVVGMPTD